MENYLLRQILGDEPSSAGGTAQADPLDSTGALFFEAEYGVRPPGGVPAAIQKKVLSVEEIDRRLEELKKSRRAAFATQYPEPYKEARERIKGFCSANRDAIVANKGLSIVFDEVAPQINSQEARTK